MDSKSERKIQVVLYNLLLDLKFYHDERCRDHVLTVALEPIIGGDHEHRAHSDIALLSVYDKQQCSVVLLAEVKMKLQEKCTSIWHTPVKDQKAFGQLLHAAVLSHWNKKHQNNGSTLLLLASDKSYHFFEVKFATHDHFVEILQYNIFQADINDDDFQNVIRFLQRELLRICKQPLTPSV